MIKANELRIGNWIKVFEDNVQVDSVDSDMIGTTAYFNGHTGCCNCTPVMAQPIPLTPDILEKCGFEGQDGYDFPTYEDKMGDRISFDRGIYKYWLGGIYQDYAEIRFLHRLQNFYFEYTNRELEVKL